MIGFYKSYDAINNTLSLPIGGGIPKKFLVPEYGYTKTTTIYLGDTDNVTWVSSNTTSSGGVVTPGSNIIIYPFGPNLANGIIVSLSVGDNPFGVSGMPVILSSNHISSGTVVPVNIQVTVAAGAEQDFNSWGIQASSLIMLNGTTLGASQTSPTAPCYVFRCDAGLSISTRLLATNRQIPSTMPGFIVGQYRWRGEDTRNATSFIPTSWDQNTSAIMDDFIAGIGCNDDLEPLDLIQTSDDNIHLEVNHGCYFTGVNGYYLPAEPDLRFYPSYGPNLTFTLPYAPTPQTPIFVGTWALDRQNFYEKNLEYRYACTLVNPDNTPRTDLPTLYYTLNRSTNSITLNTPQPTTQTLLLGTISGNPVDYFNIPVYPIYNISLVYADPGVDSVSGEPLLPLYADKFVFNQSSGTITITSTTGSGSSIKNANVGQGVYAKCSPAIAVSYEKNTGVTTTEIGIDLNPAFSGVSSGYVYLQHRRQQVASLQLACDKPRIGIPETLSSIIGLIAYGPIYYGFDYTLLTVTAYSNDNITPVPNATLNVIVDPDNWKGTLNYIDPTIEPVTVVTGADGSANLIYTPATNPGIWIPNIAAPTPISVGSLGGTFTITNTNDTLVLPEVVQVGQVWNSLNAPNYWTITTYTVLDNQPQLGMVGANPLLGQVPWATTGTPGAIGYATNGMRVTWLDTTTHFPSPDISILNPLPSVPTYPINVYDINGHNQSSEDFNGEVKYIQYATSLPTPTGLGAYFVVFTQRPTIQLQLSGSNVVSNTIMLQCVCQDESNQVTPWLTLNDTIQGVLNQYRLGWTKNGPPNVRFPGV